MAKYYYEYNGVLQEIELAQGTVTNFRNSNPHLTVLTASQVSEEQKAEIAVRYATQEAHSKRKKEYPPIGDQLDAILKQLNYMRMEGTPMVQEVDDILAKWLAVKAKHPLPEEQA